MTPRSDRSEANRILVLGIGNVLMGDEGAGVQVIRELEAAPPLPEVDLVDGGTGGFHLLEYFESYERLVLVDAATDGHPPGTVRVTEPRYAEDFPPTLTAHEIGLKNLLDAARLVGRTPRVCLVTISIGGAPRLDVELSAAVRGAIPDAVRRVKEAIEEWRGSMSE